MPKLSSVQLEDQLCGWTTQIVAIAKDIHAAQMRNDYSAETGTRHFANLLHFNISQIQKLSKQLGDRT